VIDMSADALAVVQGSYTLRCRVESWLGDELLADDVPVSSGGEEVDGTLQAPERVTLSVPRLDRGTSWEPIGIDHPLAAYGQRLKVSLGVDLGNGATEWLQRGWFTISGADTQGETVSVEAVGLLTLIDEARFVAPYQPTGTFVSTVRSLVEPALTVVVSASLTDRAVPSGMSWDEDRLGGLFELLDAWPATATVTADGYLQVDPVTIPASSLDITDGVAGTVVQWNGQATRDGAYTAVVARGQAADGGQLQGVVYDTDPASPLRSAGEFNALPVPFFFFSPLLTTVDQCRTAATSILARLRRTASRKIGATLVPHPGLQGGDTVTVTGAELDAAPCAVERLSLPYTPDGGAMNLTLRVL